MKRKPTALQKQIRRALAQTPAPAQPCTVSIFDCMEKRCEACKIEDQLRAEPIPPDAIAGAHCGKPWCSAAVHHYSPDQSGKTQPKGD